MSKSKKMKGTTLGLSEFLSAVPDAGSSWADDDHALPSGPLGGGGGYGGPSPPTGPASRGGAPAGPTKPIPDRPPFTLYVGNLGYDVDDTALGTFFFEQGCEIVQPRVVMDRTTGMSKGFGYIEFQTRDSLLRALEFNGAPLGDRNIRLDVADAPAQAGPARGYGGFRNDAGEDRAGGASTWRRAGPVDYEPAPSRGGFGDRDRSSGVWGVSATATAPSGGFR
ncbi:hypothetical protein AMAG_09176 [Allomyces macrogynus ATCC 38327]|uniref:RRM domain-containing protein n=1 Tax=Allomyces macrogynus (strain ATCC 38327) TaxID=578462 RepID=A0A0L0SP01_ALLM3|nr:hypothetical protein AMAG_09176 [Allomyces macrogynus ATCC 38327]|eukprot:KNE64114.1 hypothetical protein AMAG_09176 [Allomyces macrogynus ATCC 38327]